jgi:hypothetical protein
LFLECRTGLGWSSLPLGHASSRRMMNERSLILVVKWGLCQAAGLLVGRTDPATFQNRDQGLKTPGSWAWNTVLVISRQLLFAGQLEVRRIQSLPQADWGFGTMSTHHGQALALSHRGRGVHFVRARRGTSPLCASRHAPKSGGRGLRLGSETASTRGQQGLI